MIVPSWPLVSLRVDFPPRKAAQRLVAGLDGHGFCEKSNDVPSQSIHAVSFLALFGHSEWLITHILFLFGSVGLKRPWERETRKPKWNMLCFSTSLSVATLDVELKG
jgi:hypothetical protein